MAKYEITRDRTYGFLTGYYNKEKNLYIEKDFHTTYCGTEIVDGYKILANGKLEFGVYIGDLIFATSTLKEAKKYIEKLN